MTPVKLCIEPTRPLQVTAFISLGQFELFSASSKSEVQKEEKIAQEVIPKRQMQNNDVSYSSVSNTYLMYPDNPDNMQDIEVYCKSIIKPKMEFYVPFNSQCHIGTGP